MDYVGDFNVPFYEHEKKRKSYPIGRKIGSYGFINKEGLMDMDLQGINCTWSNKRVGDDCIQPHLDRVLISLDWTNDYVFSLSAI